MTMDGDCLGASQPEGCHLVVNADDLGWSEGVNQAVFELHDAGIVTSASLMIGGEAAWRAVDRIASHRGLAVGLHVAAVAAPALLEKRRIPTLVNEQGWFDGDCVRAGLRYTLHPAVRPQLAMELEAQFAQFHATRLEWSHVDSHRHFSLTPVVFREVLRLARTYHPAAFRIPLDDYASFRQQFPDEAARYRFLAACFAVLCMRQRLRLRGEFLTVDRSFGLFRSCRLDPIYLQRLIDNLPDGVYELVCHPDVSTDRGTAEMAALRSREFLRALETRRVILTNFPLLARRGQLPRSRAIPALDSSPARVGS